MVWTGVLLKINEEDYEVKRIASKTLQRCTCYQIQYVPSSLLACMHHFPPNDLLPFQQSHQIAQSVYSISIPMSQYIHLNDRLGEWREAHRQVLAGTLSKISVYRSSTTMSNAPSPKYMKQKVSLRVKQEQNNAYCTHEQSLQQNYVKLKHNLKVYARSKSMKLERAFQRPHFSKNQLTKEQVGRLSYKSQKQDKTVFIERKYNRQFAIQQAMATEIQEISQEKVRIKKIMSEKYVSPLTQQARLQYLNSGESAEKKEGANPVLVMSKGNPLRKKKKVYKYDFINSRTKK